MTTPESPAASGVFDRLREHDFHPLESGFTVDRELGEEGIANLDDEDWRIRLLAIRDLVRIGTGNPRAVEAGLSDRDRHVRYAAATALGALGSETPVPELIRILSDPTDIVRSQTSMALGRIGATTALDALTTVTQEDDSRDVRHQAAVAIDRIEKGETISPALATAFRTLDPATFDQLTVGEPAPDFSMPDVDENRWSLSEVSENDHWTVLIWIFADWCPVCHQEFDELIELRSEIEKLGIDVATIECSDLYRGRLMVGRELEPEYWFADESFHDRYTAEIWWPHLIDYAGTVGARYGVDPMSYAVHAEYINRPATVILDPNGVVRFAYVGTYWGDRPSIEETLRMIRDREFSFRHPKRLELDA